MIVKSNEFVIATKGIESWGKFTIFDAYNRRGTVKIPPPIPRDEEKLAIIKVKKKIVIIKKIIVINKVVL